MTDIDDWDQPTGEVPGMDLPSPAMSLVTADCWRCAHLAADRLPERDLQRLRFRMYLCPECGNKRCRKAADHERSCDKGAGELADIETQRMFRKALDERVRTEERERIAAWLDERARWHADEMRIAPIPQRLYLHHENLASEYSQAAINVRAGEHHKEGL